MTQPGDEASQPTNERRLFLERLARLWDEFLHIESASGIVLLAATCIALIASNTPLEHAYHGFWHMSLGIEVGQFLHLRYPLEHWVNDGLMAIFFFVIGLEVKRELVFGELRDARRAALPIAAAIGGMIAPAVIYFMIERGGPAAAGWGIPMATDIAFVVGCMALLGPRVPHGLRVMLLTLAIVDDIGAILVIAIGYSQGLSWNWLLGAGLGLAAVAGLQWIGVRRIAVYLVVGTFVWFAVHESGVHATIAGVILGMMTPAVSRESHSRFVAAMQHWLHALQRGEWSQQPHRAEKVHAWRRAAVETVSPLEYLESSLHAWVAFGVMPIFALANAGVEFHPSELKSPVAWAVILGLVIGKPLGVVGAALLAVWCKLAKLPERVSWLMMTAAGSLAGIGFTMALFIAGLALDDRLLDTGKVGVLAGSLLSGVIGMVLMLTFAPKPQIGAAESPSRERSLEQT